MPILLEEDYNMKLPEMYKVRQAFNEGRLEDIKGTIKNEINRDNIRHKIKQGQRVAVAVGSRGIKNLSEIVRTVIDEIKLVGGKPFIVSAMGSHGGGSEEGQREILTGYGITEEAMGVEIITQTDVVEIGKTKMGIPVYFDKSAYESDMVIPINRIKLHTDFISDIQSGICKMLVIGLGKHKGCSSIHEIDFKYFGEVLKEAAEMIMKKVNVGFGMATVENAYDQTALIKAVSSENLIEEEKALLKIAKDNMPSLMIPEIDILIVEEIGKNISGAGFDPNILGKSYTLEEFSLKVPKINKMILLDISEESHGNGIGMGVFDIVTRKVFEQLDFESIYANGIAAKLLDDCKIPLIAADEDEAIKIAVKVLRGVDINNLKIVKIKNTLDLQYIYVSEALLEYVNSNARLSLQ